MLGIADADSEETATGPSALVISRLACSLVGQTEAIRIAGGSIAHEAYGRDEATEGYRCNFGLNPAYRSAIAVGPLWVTGVGADGAVRMVELRDHPFFVATLFLPQLSSKVGAPHPLIVSFLKAAMAFRTRRRAAVGEALTG